MPQQWDRLTRSEQIHRIELQKLDEEDLYQDSIDRYWRNYDVAPDEALPEQALLDSVVRQLGDSYQEWIDRISSNNDTPAWAYPLFGVGALKMADITIRCLISSLFNSRFWLDSGWENQIGIRAQAVAQQIADTTIDIICYRDAKDSHREDWLAVSHYQKNWTPKRCRSFAAKFSALSSKDFTKKNKEDFGHHMLRIAEQSGLITMRLRRIYNGRSWRSVTTLLLSEAVCRDLATKHRDLLASCSLIYRPMLVPPVPHTEDISGGNLNIWFRKSMVQNWNEACEWEYINESRPHRGSKLSPMVIRGLNGLMYTEWAINTQVMEVMTNLFQGNTKVANLPAYSFDGFEFQEAYPTEGSKAEQAIWCVAKEESWSSWFKEEQKRQRMLLRLIMAEKLAQKDFFYHVYTCDFRGRGYTVCDLLSPQGGDFDKALVHFANPEKQTPQGLYWLKVHVANLFDQDKQPFDARVQWVDDNMTWLRAIADDPYDNKHLWVSDKAKKNPSFQRLAAILDLCRTDGMTQLPPMNDGVCNGSQHWAAIMRDVALATQVNLVPTDKPNDLYQVVADTATSICKTQPSKWRDKFLVHWDGGIDRTVTKRPTMCDSYGLTFYGIRKYLKSEGHINTDWVPKEETAAAVMEMATVIDLSLKEVLDTANQGKNYLKLIADIASRSENHLEWTTPCGFKVSHRYFPTLTRRSVAKLFDMKELHFGIKDFDSVDSRNANLAIAPNFIHSLDASHMWQTIDRMLDAGIESFSFIHDSFGCPAPSVPVMRQIIKEEFMKTHRYNPLESFHDDVSAKLGITLPMPPATGDLRIEQVLDAEYLFG